MWDQEVSSYLGQQSQLMVTCDRIPVGFHKVSLCASPLPFQFLLQGQLGCG